MSKHIIRSFPFQNYIKTYEKKKNVTKVVPLGFTIASNCTYIETYLSIIDPESRRKFEYIKTPSVQLIWWIDSFSFYLFFSWRAHQTNHAKECVHPLSKVSNVREWRIGATTKLKSMRPIKSFGFKCIAYGELNSHELLDTTNDPLNLEYIT